MLNKVLVKAVLDDIRFGLDLLDSDMPQIQLINDSKTMLAWLDDTNLTFKDQIASNSSAQTSLSKLKVMLDDEEALPPSEITVSEIRDLYFALKAGELIPISFSTRQYHRDFIGSEFVDSEKVKLMESNESDVYSARYAEVHTRAMVEGLIAKYKPRNVEELSALFKEGKKNDKK